MLAAEALLEFRHLSLTGLGRTLNTNAKVKHAIKRMDRLFGNCSLQKHKLNYYKEIINYFIKNNQQPIIVVDWSGLTRCGQFHFDPRSLTIHKLYDKFLEALPRE